MRITQLKTHNWKGISEDTPLSPLNLFVGPNGSGKTARLIAAQYAIEGTTPLGATPDAAMALVSQCPGGVRMALDDGFSFSRMVTRDREGKVTSSAKVTGHDHLKLRDSHDMIREHCGDFAPMFDLGAFTRMASDKRRDAIMNLCGTDAACDIPDLLSRIRLKYLEESLGVATATDLIAGQLKGKSEAELSTADRLMLCELLATKLSEAERQALDVACDQVRDAIDVATSQTSAIGLALAEAKNNANLTKRTHTEKNAAANQLAQEHASLRVVAESVEVLRARQSELNIQRDTLRTDIDKHDAWVRSIEVVNRSVVMAEAKVAELETALEAAKRKAEQAPDLRKQAEEFEAKANGRAVAFAAPVDSQDIASAQARLRELEALHDACARQIREAVSHHGIMSRHRDSIAIKVNAAKNDPWREAQRLVAGFREAISGLHVVKDEIMYSVAELETFIGNQLSGPTLAQLQADLDAAQKAVDSAHDGCVGARARADQAVKDVAEQRTFIDQLIAARNEQQNQILAVRDEIREATQAAKDLRRDAAALDAALETATSQLIEARDRLLTLRRQKDESHTAAGNINRDLSAENLVAIENHIGDLTKMISAKISHAALEAKLQETRAAAERAMVEHETLKKLADAIRVFRDQLMGELVSPLLSSVDKFLAASGKGVTAYADLEDARGKPCLDLGWVTDSRRIPLDAMSGGETALFSAALAYALIMLGDPALKLLLIEASELDAVHMVMLLAALESIQNDVGNVIVATHKADIVVSEAWNVVPCGRKEMVTA